jgi:hypothetical protein
MNQLNSLHAVRIDTHRVTLMPDCAPEGGEPHEPPLARPARVGRSRVFREDPVPKGYARALIARGVATLVLVALCCVAAWAGFTLALPKPAPDLPRTTAKVTT